MAPNASWLMGDSKVLGWDGERAADQLNEIIARTTTEEA